ncbi:hypothetical protein P8625_05400 [Tenacibaculum tangerinum]|uniref:Uncharacterized protein n=1 Tax=Tenacibaculum tangerinum TaxID=3038772 RepID=A0ABY8L9B0_9FLAO|nr:hypothetical protein [Tenacibaculum tangerinum]WGH76595.1 hypothetical protein P8625_05400 [Tenacibaculum tangerinum]
MKKVLPFLYLVIGIVILVSTFNTLFQEKTIYRVLFSFTTENKYVFVGVRLLFASWFIVDGIKKLQQNTTEQQ